MLCCPQNWGIQKVETWRKTSKISTFVLQDCVSDIVNIVFSLLVSGEVWRATESREAGRHYLLQIFRFWETVWCSPELPAEAQIWLWRHEMLAKVRHSLTIAARLPQTRVQLSTVQGMVCGCTACGSPGDPHYSTWNGQSGLHRHEGVECNAQYGSGSLNSHRFLCSIPTHLLPSWEIKSSKIPSQIYLLSILLPDQYTVYLWLNHSIKSVTILTQVEKKTSVIQELQPRKLSTSYQIWLGLTSTCTTRSNHLYLHVRHTYRGCVHSWRLHILRMGFGFLLASQKLRWTILLSLFLRHPYLVYWNPGKYFRKIRKNRSLLEFLV